MDFKINTLNVIAENIKHISFYLFINLTNNYCCTFGVNTQIGMFTGTEVGILIGSNERKNAARRGTFFIYIICKIEKNKELLINELSNTYKNNLKSVVQ